MLARIFARSKPGLIGCALSENAIHLIQLSGSAQDMTVTAWATESLCMYDAEKPGGWAQSLDQAIEKALTTGRFKPGQVVLSLPCSQMGYRRLRMAPMPAEELPAAVQWRAARELSLSVSAFESSFYDVGPIQEQGRTLRDVIAVTTTTADIERSIQSFQRIGRIIHAVDATAGSLARTLAWREPSAHASESKLIIEVGVCSSAVIVIRKARPCFIRTIPGGRNQTIQRAMARLNIAAENQPKLWALLQQAITPEEMNDSDALIMNTLNEVAALHAAELAREVTLCTHYLASLNLDDLALTTGCIVGAGNQEEVFLSKIKDVCELPFTSLEGVLDASVCRVLKHAGLPGSMDSWLTAAGLSLYEYSTPSASRMGVSA